MTFRLVAPLIVASLSVIQLHPQTVQAGSSQPRVVKNVQAESEDVPVTGPIDAAMDSAVVPRKIEVGEDTAYINLKPPTTKVTARQTGIALAGPSAVLAVGKLGTRSPRASTLGSPSSFRRASARSHSPPGGLRAQKTMAGRIPRLPPAIR